MSNRRDIQRTKRGKLFLKGPIYFEWISKIYRSTARLLLVARAFMDMEQKSYPYIKSLGLCRGK